MSQEKSTNAENKCYKCGEKGHFANKCFDKESKKKINEIFYHTTHDSEDENDVCICCENCESSSESLSSYS